MTTNRKRFSQFLLAVIFSCTASLVQAQPGDPGDDPDPAVPFDGGLSLVVAAGIAYAAKKGYDKRKKVSGDGSAEK